MCAVLSVNCLPGCASGTYDNLMQRIFDSTGRTPCSYFPICNVDLCTNMYREHAARTCVPTAYPLLSSHHRRHNRAPCQSARPAVSVSVADCRTDLKIVDLFPVSISISRSLLNNRILGHFSHFPQKAKLSGISGIPIPFQQGPERSSSLVRWYVRWFARVAARAPKIYSRIFASPLLSSHLMERETAME